MSEVLYRKYRAKNFRELVGQEHIKRILIESVKSAQISHAYLFAGPRGTGKTSTARLMAKAVNCLDFTKYNDACGECENCLLVNSGNSVDIIEMDAASNRGIEEIRTLKESINFVPSSLKYKIYIIDEVHMLTKEAFNALLKTLEEPPTHVIFVLATTEPHKLPVTILSRVQRYDFSLGSKEEIKQKINFILKTEGIETTEEVLDVIYKISGGSFRDAESLLSKLTTNINAKTIEYDEVKKVLGLVSSELLEKFTISVMSKDIDLSFSYLDEIEYEVSDLSFFTTQLISYLKDLIISELKEKNLENINGYRKIIEEFIKVKGDFRIFDDKKLLMQMAVLRISEENIPYEVVKNVKKVVVEKTEEKVTETTSIPQKVKVEDKEVITNTNQDIVEKFIGEAREYNHSLKAILAASSVRVVDKKVLITTQSSFNLKQLEKANINKFLQEWWQKNYSKDVKIEIAKGEVDDAEVVHIKSAPASVIEKKEDNSSIVEDIL